MAVDVVIVCVCGCGQHDGECDAHGCTIFEEDNGTDLSPTATGSAYHWAFGDEEYDGSYYYGVCM